MKEMITEREKSLESSRHDLFSKLIEASRDEGAASLDEDEIIGNIFIFLVAGHEVCL